MSSLRQLPPHDDLGPTQPVAHLALDPGELENRYGIRFTRDHDDFDNLLYAIVEVAGWRFLLSRYVNNPEPGTTVESFDAGDPVSQAVTLVRALDVGSDVTAFWDGSQWQHGPLQATAR